MRALTATELADILFQKPERLTAGVLKERSSMEKFKDEFFTYQEKGDMRSGEPGILEKLRKKLLLHFEAAAKVAPEHPRSLKKAAFELKALGFSNGQIEKIKECCYRFTLSYCEPHAPLKHILYEDHPGHGYDWCDDAFFGAALVPLVEDGKYAKTRQGLFASVDEYDRNRNDPARTKNTIFTAPREDQAYEIFQGYLSSYVEKMGGAPLFLMPAGPRQRYGKICP